MLLARRTVGGTRRDFNGSDLKVPDEESLMRRKL
jgi:hypothetical protein